MQTQRLDGAGVLYTLVDPGHPNLFLVTVPSLLMIMLGVRRLGVIYFFGSVMFLTLRNIS